MYSESEELMLLLFQFGQITPQLALKVLVHFDRTMNNSLALKVKNRLTFKVPFHPIRIEVFLSLLFLMDIQFRQEN